MTARSTVILGVGILLAVLLGTLTVGSAPAFYAGLTAVFAVAVVLVMLFGRGGPAGRY
ncbi:hypothetical protein [Azospirillum sp. ST 5-10]|uniref:hypothetical protein n=1 Tax=unclassified Azospirillum TaxID=2630922 RepID=UPI003F4A382A